MSKDFRVGHWLVRPDHNQIESAGRPTRLQPQIMQLLVYLSDHASEVVSREQILEALWNGSFVSDEVVRNTVGKLRKALDDDIKNPRFIETVPKKGYRLIATVSSVQEISEVKPSRRKGALMTVAVVASVLAAAAWVWFPSSSDSPDERPSDWVRPSVAVFYFQNLSADTDLEWLSAGLPEMLVADLSQSPRLEVLTMERLYQTLMDMDLPDERPRTQEEIRIIGEQVKATAVVLGSYVRSGEAIRINIRVEDSRTGDVLGAASVEGMVETGIFPLVDELTVRVRTHLGTPAVMDAMLDRGLQEISTSSVEAYRYYSEGQHLMNHSKFEEAIPLFERAVEIDPRFALAYANLAKSRWRIGEKAGRFVAAARKNMDRLSVRERLWLEGLTNPSTAKAFEANREAVKLYPDMESAGYHLTVNYLMSKQYDEAVDQAEALKRRGSSNPDVFDMLARGYAALGKFREAQRVSEEFLRDHPDSWMAHATLGQILMHWGKLDEARAALKRSETLRTGNMYVEMRLWMLHVLAEDWQDAEAVTHRIEAGGHSRWERMGRTLRALTRLHQGRSAEAIQGFEEAGALGLIAVVLLESDLAGESWETVRGELDKTPFNRFTASVALQELERFEEAEAQSEKILQSLETPYHGMTERLHHSTRGYLALGRGDGVAALQAFTRAESALAPRGDFSPMSYPSQNVPIWYGLALSHIELGRDDLAEGWFQRVADSTIEHLWFPVPYVRSLYFLGKIHEERGDLAVAQEYYERFLKYREDGDMDRDYVEDALRRRRKSITR